ncbi:MAG: hypothetical protein LBE12_03990 [Planctomycetaceae bacterium]|nr:hypothetical protein [Planctomycetaceae bacterium]
MSKIFNTKSAGTNETVTSIVPIVVCGTFHYLGLTKNIVIVYFGPQIAQIYADFRPAIFTDIRSLWIFEDSFLRVGNNETNKGRIDKKYKK